MSSQRLGSVDSVTIRNLNTERTEDLRDLSVEALEARRSQRGRAATKKRRKNLCKAQTFSRLVVQRTHSRVRRSTRVVHFSASRAEKTSARENYRSRTRTEAGRKRVRSSKVQGHNNSPSKGAADTWGRRRKAASAGEACLVRSLAGSRAETPAPCPPWKR